MPIYVFCQITVAWHIGELSRVVRTTTTTTMSSAVAAPGIVTFHSSRALNSSYFRQPTLTPWLLARCCIANGCCPR